MLILQLYYYPLYIITVFFSFSFQNALLRKLPGNIHIPVTNFVWSLFTVFVESRLTNESLLVRFSDIELNTNVSIRLYEPVKEINTTRPGIMFFHGGGMMYGNTGNDIR